MNLLPPPTTTWYDMINPAELKRKISKLQDKLLKLNTLKQKVRKDILLNGEPYGYILTWYIWSTSLYEATISLPSTFLCEATGF